MTVTPKSPSVHPATPSKHLTSLRSRQGLMDELDSLRSKFLHEDSLAFSSTEPSNIEESKYASLQGELEADAQDLEGDSWSLVVDQDFLKPMSKESIKRQDVIYEFIQTESHHVRTLKILLRVYKNELSESALIEEARLKSLFYGLDGLLVLHSAFLQCLKQRRLQSMAEGSPRNYQITQLADILTAQFSGEPGESMTNFYGAFCYYHRNAVTFYKDLLQNNKKFQTHMRKIGQLSIVRRLGIPECFLLVTQRITKYPVLVERIIQNTEETEEHRSLVQALALIRDCISQVDSQVSGYEKATRLKVIAQRLEPKSQCLLKDGRVFSREDLMEPSRTLQHEATFTIKESSGKHKEVNALLLTDVLILLQDKDQKLVFKMMDNKSPVISLQRLIVREVAQEDKAMFLICASSDNYVMYEIHTGSKAKRDTWMALIRQAVESCPTLEVKAQEEEQETRSAKLKEFQETLARRDMLIEKNLNEKLQIFTFFYEDLTGKGTPHKGLLLRGDASDLQQGETLLMGAIKDVEGLQDLLLARIRDPSQATEDSQGQQQLPLRRAQTFGGFDTKPPGTPMEEGAESQAGGEDDPVESSRLSTSSDPGHPDPEHPDPEHPDPEHQDPEHPDPEHPDPEHPDPEHQDPEHQDPEHPDPELYPESRELSADDDEISSPDSPGLSSADMEFFDQVLQLSIRLYSLLAIIAQQDSRADLQQMQPAYSAGAGAARRNSTDLLLEQERQRNLEKQREEQASFQRQQAQHRQEQQRWEKECERRRAHAQQLEARLAEREEECGRREERLAAAWAELEGQRATYQGDLVRLRESAQKVERERQQLEIQQQKQQKQSDQFLRATQSFSVDRRRASPDRHADPTTAPTNHIHIHNHNHHHSSSSSSGGGGGGGHGGEVPPLVPPRKHSMSPKPAVVPLQLVSTTNQTHKAGGVQQQIPTKLAVLKGKTPKSSKGHHRGSHQRAASIDMSQVVPIKMTGKEGGSLRAVSKTSASPQIINSDRFTHRTPPNVKPSQSFSAHIKSHDPPPPPPPPFPKDLLKKEKERVVFL